MKPQWWPLLRFLWHHRRVVVRVAVYFPPNETTDTPNKLFWLNEVEG